MAASRLREACRYLLAVLVLAVGCIGGDATELEANGDARSAETAGAVALEVSGLPATLQAGTTGTMTVRAVAPDGSTAAAYTGTVHLSANAWTTTLPPDYTFQAEDQGVHAFDFTPIQAALHILYASDTQVPSLLGYGTVPVVAGPLANFYLDNFTHGQPLTAGAQAHFDVAAYDRYWNVATTYQGPGVVTSSDPGAILPPNPTFANGAVFQVPITLVRPGYTTVEIHDAADPSVSWTQWVLVNPASTPDNVPETPAISAADAVTTGAAASASVTARTGMTYAWTVTGGTITGPGGGAGVTGGGLNTISYMPGDPGTLGLACVESNGTDTSAPGTASVSVVEAPATPEITTASAVASGQMGVTASVPARPGMTYAWSIGGATITSPGGPAGVAEGGTNGITFTAGMWDEVSLGCQEINAAGAASAPASATIPIIAGGDPTAHVYFVAHQDDDLLFMNPDIERSIFTGRPTQTVFVTAGDDGSCPECWHGREQGVKNAHASIAGVPSSWSCAPRAFHGKTVTICVLDGAPTVRLVFLRLPDGGLASLWTTQFGPPFWTGSVASLTAVDQAYSVTREEIVTLLRDLILDVRPARIGTLDSSMAYGDDHQDHTASALFSFDASTLDMLYSEYRMYRGYNMFCPWSNLPSPERENLSPADYAEKVRVMEAYAGAFPADSDFDRWSHRQYTISSVAPGTGPLVTPEGACLDTQDGGGAAGTPVVVAACTGALHQRWTVTPEGTISRGADQCLTLVPGTWAVAIGDCLAGSPMKRLTVFRNGQIRAWGGRCLEASWSGAVVAALCDADRSMPLYAPLPRQRFTLQFGAPSPWSGNDDFGDAVLGASASYYRTFGLGRVDADERPDACVRRAEGLCCGLAGPTGFGACGLVSADFSDAAGWSPERYGTSVQLADVNGDGFADACGRNATGIACAVAPAGGGPLGPIAQWSTDFGDAISGSDAYYPSLRLADVDGDGFADVCGNTSLGIACALNTKTGTFAPATTWLAGDIGESTGWAASTPVSAVRLGDIDGDGRADVCYRRPDGLYCAVSNGEDAFTGVHSWSFRGDFGDAEHWIEAAAYYGSIRLADVNGDSLADACGAGPDGFVCAVSNGTSFEAAEPLLPLGVTQALGWAMESRGTGLQLADLNGDGRADVCGRSPQGLSCSLAP